MALQKQNIPVPFGQGINTKVDPKQLPPGPLTNLQNGIFTEQGAINKRKGLDLLSRSIDSTGDLILQGEALSTFSDQLLLFTGSKAYSKLEFNDKWTFKGNVSSVINSTFQVIRNEYQQSNPDVAIVDGLECYVWEDSRGGIRYSIVDTDTGNFAINDSLITLEGSKPKVLTVAGQFVILFVYETTIKYTRITTSTLSAPIVIFTLANDLHENQIYDACSSIGDLNYGGVDTSYHNIFVTYAGRFDASNVYTSPRTYKINATTAVIWSYDFTVGATAPAHIAVAAISDVSFGLAAQVGPTSIIMWDDGTNLKIGKIPYYIGPLTSLNITIPVDFDLSLLQAITIAWNGKLFTDQIALDVYLQSQITNRIVQFGLLDVFIHGEVFAVGELANLKMKKNVALYSKAFIWNNNSYVIVSHSSDLQPTYFILNSSLEVVSKANQTLAGGHRTAGLTEVATSYTLEESIGVDGYTFSLPESEGIFKAPTLKKGKLQSEVGFLFSRLGITSTQMDFASANHFLSKTLNNNLHVVGGVLQSYDGNRFTENGFHLYPEDVTAATSLFVTVVVTPGTGVAAEATDIFCVAGSRIKSGDYWTIYSGLDERAYYVWYRVDGVGTDPAVSGKIGIQVNINSYDSATQVATATKSVLNLYYIDFTATSSTSVVRVTNTIPGATTNAGVGTMTIGGIGAGTYQYIAIWKWQDNQGVLHRSTTSVPVSITVATSLNTISITVPILSLTRKPNVILEVYRTENNGSVFYKTTSILTPSFNIQNNDSSYVNNVFVDNVSDADLINNELLYTTGGILDNNSPPPCSIIEAYKNRVFIAGLDNKNTIQYSKISPPDQKDFGVGFSDLFTIELDNSGGDIVGLFNLDDKLIIFKEKEIYYINGDGPNNTGSGSTFTEPQLITTDVGCLNANSIVTSPNGLMFKSSKGIYLLNRGLQVSYVGAAVENFNNLIISSAVLLNDANQIRFTTEDGAALIYNYFYDQWSTFTNYEAVDCDLFQDQFVLLRSNGYVMQEGATYADGYAGGTQHIPLILETANFSLAGLNGFQRVYRASILGEYKGTHNTIVSFAYDYSPVYIDSATFDGYNVIGQYTYGATGPYGEAQGDIYGGNYEPFQFRIHLKQQKCTAIRVKIEDTQSEPFNEGFNISALTLQVGIKASTYKLPGNKSLGSD